MLIQRPLILRSSAAAAPVNLTWDPATTPAGWTLSSGNAQVTKTTPTGGQTDTTVIGNYGRSSGKYSFRLTTQNNTHIAGGVANQAGLAYAPTSDTKECLRDYTVTALDVIVNIDTKKIWFIVDGTNDFNGGTPAAGTGGWAISVTGLLYPATDPYIDNDNCYIDGATSRYTGFPGWNG